MSLQSVCLHFTVAAVAAMALTGCPERGPAPQPVEVAPAQATVPDDRDPDAMLREIGDRVYFDYDRFELRPDAQETLQQQAAFLQARPGIPILIEGHCDERGTREYNLALGERRAESVKSYLIALGVTADRIETVSYGKERPAVDGSDEAIWALNRRGVTVLAPN
ncbi:MAG: peptidoglycan-associated lipoprotein Pal [Dongiaceae bacterium]